MKWIDPKKQLPNYRDYIFVLKRRYLKQKYDIIAGEYDYCPDGNHNKGNDLWKKGVFRSQCDCPCICSAECFTVNGEHFSEDIIGWALQEDVIHYLTKDYIDTENYPCDTCDEDVPSQPSITSELE